MLLGGKPAWSVEMLAVLLVLTLVPTLSDGLLLKKCDLKSQLEKALSDLQGKNNEEMIAKLVCTLEHISGFNTSLVTITDQFSNRPFLHGNYEEHSSEISDQDTELPEDYNGQHKKRRNAPSMDGGDGSGEASIDQSAENTEADHGPTDLPPGTTEEPSIYYDTFEMLFGFTTSPPETTTTLPPEEPTDPIYYDDFETIFGFTTPPPDTSEEHADYYDEQGRKRRDAPSMDGGDGSGEASIDQSAENTEADHGPTDLPPGTTEEPSIYYDTFEMLFGFTTSPPETTTTLPPEEPIYYDDFETIFGFTTPPPDVSEEHADYYDKFTTWHNRGA
ncbi:uncharacterized protein wu:fj19g03 [Clarias gariepinus]|uniref:uncharacterized protein wu:fj19g03 n=1 Tax=Clarias gariepinus TaxID=13013 RepID=UPI00234E2148|nr:uncharacterized protein wu:fj19g03 [Clarias gariepinus]